ncbi:aa3-type cytochrome c oxidase subunit IV [Flavisphingomonas formosensis]|nr:aa3-type cytochrome c oxidase subunit IV [Sphingomonas formosensis]
MADSAGDFKAHEQTYDGFISLLKVGTVLTALVTILVIFLITR